MNRERSDADAKLTGVAICYAEQWYDQHGIPGKALSWLDLAWLELLGFCSLLSFCPLAGCLAAVWRFGLNGVDWLQDKTEPTFSRLAHPS